MPAPMAAPAAVSGRWLSIHCKPAVVSGLGGRWPAKSKYVHRHNDRRSREHRCGLAAASLNWLDRHRSLFSAYERFRPVESRRRSRARCTAEERSWAPSLA
jgi:hypothetical protein